MREALVMELPTPTLIDLPGRDDISLSVHEQGSGPAVLLCHGFPDLAYGWRHQLPALAAAGYRAIAPDQRGYGASSRPHAVEAYGMTELAGDLVALLDALGIDRAVLVGHDWGGFVAWGTAVLHPDRVEGVAGICTPYIPFPSVATHLAAVDGSVERQYVAWFQEDGVAEAAMDPDVEVIFDRIMRTGVPLDQVLAAAFATGELNMNPFLRPEDFPTMGEPLDGGAAPRHYADVYARTGFRGGVNWYRNVDRNRADHPDVGVAPLTCPTLMLTAEFDPALTPALAEGMRDRCTDLELHMIERAGHWVTQERPDAVNELLVSWLERNFPT